MAAVFFLGLFVKRASAGGAICGLFVGVGVNLGFWLFFPRVSWLWWNAIGFLDTLLLGCLVSYLCPSRQGAPTIRTPREKTGWKIWYGLLFIYTALLIVFLGLFSRIFV